MDPESGLVWSRFRLWKLEGATRVPIRMNYINGDLAWPGTYEVNALSPQDRTQSSQKVWPDAAYGFFPGNIPGNMSGGMYPHGWALLGKGVLHLGATYLLEGFLFNIAGGVAKMSLNTFIADWTRPVCSTPSLDPVGSNIVRMYEYPDGSSSYDGVRQFNWVAPGVQQIAVRYDDTTCVDPESGIHALFMSVGTENTFSEANHNNF